MVTAKNVTEWMKERGMSLEGLLHVCPLDNRVIEAIVDQRYTPSPEQRQRVATALG